jgi:hypothetical protein
VSGLILNPSQNQLSIDFVGLGLAAGEGLKYQYKLAGANNQSGSGLRFVRFSIVAAQVLFDDLGCENRTNRRPDPGFNPPVDII